MVGLQTPKHQSPPSNFDLEDFETTKNTFPPSGGNKSKQSDFAQILCLGDKLLKPRQAFRTTLKSVPKKTAESSLKKSTS